MTDILFSNSFLITVFYVVVIILFFIVVIGKTLYWTYIWQLKEYRTDRMLDFLSTRSGKKATLNTSTIAELLLLIAVIIFVLPSQATFDLFGSIMGYSIVAFFLAILLFEGAQYMRWRITPVWTAKAIIITSITVLTLCIALYVLDMATGWFIGTIICLALSPLVVSMWVFLLQPVTSMQKRRIMQQAKEKIDHLQPIVIGITGSYGKTSTKHYLQTILEQKFSVLSTPKNINVDIGVAQTILNQLDESHDVFIVEMGAYKSGEIKAICDLVSPIIGVVTAINEQHLALFGSLETIKNTKAELLEALPKSGLAVVNKNNNSCIEIMERSRAIKKYFSVDDIAHCYASDVVVQPREIQMTLHIQKNKKQTYTRLHGQQVLPSVLAAATVADHLGLSLDEICSGIEKLKSVEGTMHLRSGVNHCMIVDDHYNANPDGFLAAIDYLQLFDEQRKIIITPGMQELGSETDSHHRNVGTRAGEIADKLIITKRDFATPLQEAAKSGGLQEQQIIVNEKPQQVIEQLQDVTDKDVILIEGRIHQSILKYLFE